MIIVFACGVFRASGSIPIYLGVPKIPTICNTSNYFLGRMLHVYYVGPYIRAELSDIFVDIYVFLVASLHIALIKEASGSPATEL